MPTFGLAKKAMVKPLSVVQCTGQSRTAFVKDSKDLGKTTVSFATKTFGGKVSAMGSLKIFTGKGKLGKFRSFSVQLAVWHCSDTCGHTQAGNFACDVARRPRFLMKRIDGLPRLQLPT